MSICVNGRFIRSAVAVAALVVGAAALTGCTTLGSRALGGPETTGSIGATSAYGGAGQPMPTMIAQAQPQNGRLVPPENIGPGFGGQAPAMAATAYPSGQGSMPSVTRQDLPALTSSMPSTPSSSFGSQQAMPAQPMAQVAAMPQPQTNLPPVIAGMPSSMPSSPPRLAVVADNSKYTHVIESGESLYTIARRYDVSTQDIIQANGFSSPDKIFVGQRLVIPGRPDLGAGSQAGQAVQMAAVEEDVSTGLQEAAPMVSPGNAAALANPQALNVPERNSTPAQQAAVSLAVPETSGADKFRWPVSGRVITDFAASKKTGINIEAPEGAPVRAAENGSVIYVGSDVQGYGNLVLIRHDNGYVSAYAHLKDMAVGKGDAVKRGDTIGSAGMTGSVNRPQVHFELRKGATPVDPMPLLAS